MGSDGKDWTNFEELGIKLSNHHQLGVNPLQNTCTHTIIKYVQFEKAISLQHMSLDCGGNLEKTHQAEEQHALMQTQCTQT